MSRQKLFAGAAVVGMMIVGCGNESPDPGQSRFSPEPVDFSKAKAARQANSSPQLTNSPLAPAPTVETTKPEISVANLELRRAWDVALRVTVDGFLGEPEEDASDDFDIEISYREEAVAQADPEKEKAKEENKPATGEESKEQPKEEKPKKEEANKEEPKKDEPPKEEPKKAEPPKEERPAYRDPRSSVPPPNFSKKGPMPSGLPSFFDEFDKNGDGQIALYEWPRDRRAEFERYDRNGDGFLTPEEVLQGLIKPAPSPSLSGNSSTSKPTEKPADKPAGSDPKKEPPKPADPNAPIDEKFIKQAKETIRDYDSNKDGKLDKGELEKTRSLKFAVEKYDANKDGSLDEQEVAAWWRDGGPGGRGPGGGGPGGGGWGSPESIAKRNLEQYDKNKDGKLSKEEFEANRWNRTPFKDVDTNGDGFADENELIEQAKKFMGGGRGPGGR